MKLSCWTTNNCWLLNVVLTVGVMLFSQLPASSGLKCKCTQNSPKTPCNNGACEVPDDAACLMLDHPTSGRHYACSVTKLKEGECTEKPAKSGATVKVCSCNSSSFCNFKLWPRQSDDLDEEEEWVPISNNRKEPVRKGGEEPNKASHRTASLVPAIIIPLIVLAFL